MKPYTYTETGPITHEGQPSVVETKVRRIVTQAPTLKVLKPKPIAAAMGISPLESLSKFKEFRRPEEVGLQWMKPVTPDGKNGLEPKYKE